MEPIEDFLSTYKKESSRSSRSIAVRKFFFYLYPARVPEPVPGRGNAHIPDYEPVAGEYLALVKDGEEGKKKAVRDLTGYMNSLDAYSPMGQHNYLGGAVAFLDHHGIEVSPSERRKIKRQAPPNVPISEDEVLTREKIALILNHSTAQMKALIMVLASSGCRVGEVLALTVDRVDLESDPVALKIPKEFSKNKLPRTVYISSECTKVLREWMKYRAEYIKRKTGPRSYRTSPKDERLFPFKDSAAWDMFVLSLQKAGLHKVDVNTGKATLSLHDCRKFFRTNMARAGGNALDIVERLMGHKGAYLAENYVRMPAEDIKRFYKDNEHLIFIYPGMTDKDRDNMKNLSIKNEELMRKVEALEATVQVLGGLLKKAEVSPSS